MTEQCGFEVLHTVQGKVTITRELDESGEVIEEMARIQGLRHTLIGPSGATLAFSDVGVDKTIFKEDGSITIAGTGVLGLRFNVPGEGLVFANIGRVVRTVSFDPDTGDVVGVEVHSEAGQRPDDFDSDEAIEVICAALAP